MKYLIFLVLFVMHLPVVAQTDYYTKKGFVVEGYDVTEYFNDKALKGDLMYMSNYDKAKFLFVSKENKEKFDANPKKYIPQYGGYCAYAIGLKNEKVKVDPETFEIRGGKLYLFYNSWGINTLDLWNAKGVDKLKKQADLNWKELKIK